MANLSTILRGEKGVTIVAQESLGRGGHLDGWTELQRACRLAKGDGLVTETYVATESFPRSEMFGLTSQLRRAVISVPSNIAEGQGRDSQKEFLYHLSVAYGSLMEAETQIQIAVALSFVEKRKADTLLEQCGEVGRMLNGLTRSLRGSATNVTDNRQSATDN